VAPPEQLVRVVAEAGGGLAVGRNRPGRGAWLCLGSPPCFEAAKRRRAFDRALRTTVDKAAVEGLGTMLAERGRINS